MDPDLEKYIFRIQIFGTHLSLYAILSSNIVWCMESTGRVVDGVSYTAQMSLNCIAVEWVMHMGGGNKGMVDSCTHKNK